MLDVRKTLGNRIKECRKSKNMTQSALAEAVGVDPKYISRIETGISYPSLAVLERIFNVLNINLNVQANDFILQGDNNDRNNLIKMINHDLENTSLKNIRMVKDIVSAITASRA